MAENEEALKSLLMKMKEQNKKAGLKLSIQKSKITTSGPITSWQLEGEKVEVMTNLIFLAPKSLWMLTLAMKFKDFLEGKL